MPYLLELHAFKDGVFGLSTQKNLVMQFITHIKLIIHRVIKKCTAKPTEGKSTPQYEKQLLLHEHGPLKHGFQVTTS